MGPDGQKESTMEENEKTSCKSDSEESPTDEHDIYSPVHL